MTISSSVSKATLNGDGVQTEFPFAFKVWKAGDLEVSITSPAGANTVVTEWTADLVGNGGTVTYPTVGDPLPLGWKITIRRFMDFLQDVDLVSGTRFDPEVIETALDIATAERQQLLEEISRTMRVGVASSEDPANVLNQVFVARDDAEAAAAAAQVSAANAANDTSALLSGYVVDAQTAKAGAELAEAGAKLAEDGAQAAQLAAEAISTEAAARAYNHIINGNFDIWQRGTSQTANGYGSDDRWSSLSVGSSKTHSREVFATGSSMPDGLRVPLYYSRTVVSSVANAANYAIKIQAIEDVRRLAGRKVTLSFYAKANAPKNVSVEFTQYFGTGGSPSASVNSIGVNKVALTTAWQKFTMVVELPSVEGKIVGTDGNTYTQLAFWFDAGSNFNSRSASLGHQSGTFDIACVSLVEGDIDVKPIPRSIGEELGLCLRFTQLIRASNAFHSVGTNAFNSSPIVYHMRQPPSVTNIANVSSVNISSAVYEQISKYGFRFTAVAVATGNTTLIQDLLLDSEL